MGNRKKKQSYDLSLKVKVLSHVRLFVTPWTVAHQAPLSMGFSRQENWSGLPFPTLGNLADTEVCQGPAPADPGYSKERRHRQGSGNNCLIKR